MAFQNQLPACWNRCLAWSCTSSELPCGNLSGCTLGNECAPPNPNVMYEYSILDDECVRRETMQVYKNVRIVLGRFPNQRQLLSTFVSFVPPCEPTDERPQQNNDRVHCEHENCVNSQKVIPKLRCHRKQQQKNAIGKKSRVSIDFHAGIQLAALASIPSPTLV